MNDIDRQAAINKYEENLVAQNIKEKKISVLSIFSAAVFAAIVAYFVSCVASYGYLHVFSTLQGFQDVLTDSYNLIIAFVAFLFTLIVGLVKR